jgi:uncharacterized protein YrrD
MLRTKDFVMKDVMDISGKRLGFIKDLLINFHQGKVFGFSISSYSLFTKSAVIMTEDIVVVGNVMIVKAITKAEFQSFKDLKGMEVINLNGDILGELEDVIFDNSYGLKGIMISSGPISRLFKAKTILLTSQVILGDHNILYVSKESKVNLQSMPHTDLFAKGEG